MTDVAINVRVDSGRTEQASFFHLGLTRLPSTLATAGTATSSNAGRNPPVWRPLCFSLDDLRLSTSVRRLLLEFTEFPFNDGLDGTFHFRDSYAHSHKMSTKSGLESSISARTAPGFPCAKYFSRVKCVFSFARPIVSIVI